MIVMADTSEGLASIAAETGCESEQLLTPLTRRKLHPEGRFAVDNGAFSPAFDLQEFIALLKRNAAHKRRCRFVAVPDVVGNARRTLELFEFWRLDDRLRGWPLALVAQNGMEDLSIPWRHLSAIFIGGDTRWKTGEAVKDIIRTAKRAGCWIHVGRVNTGDRFDMFEGMGVDSVDGTGVARFTHMREGIANRASRTGLFAEAAVCHDR